jgi:hypothetical protein
MEFKVDEWNSKSTNDAFMTNSTLEVQDLSKVIESCYVKMKAVSSANAQNLPIHYKQGCLQC